MTDRGWASAIGDPLFVPVCLSADGRCTAAADADAAAGEPDRWVAIGAPGLRLNPRFVEIALKAIGEKPQIDIFYGDEVACGLRPADDEIILKPALDTAMLVADDYVGLPLLVRGRAMRRLGGLRPEAKTAASYDLVLRALTMGLGIDRITEVIGAHAEPRPRPRPEDRQAVLREWLAGFGDRFDIGPGIAPGTLRLQRRFDVFPEVTIVVLTRREVGRHRQGGEPPRPVILDCLDSIARTDWPMEKLRVLVGDALADEQIYKEHDWPFHFDRIVSSGQQQSNCAAMLNQLWRASGTEYLVLIDDAVVASSPDWLPALLTFTTQDDVGAAGARLLSPAGRVRHAGMPGEVSDPATPAWAGQPASSATYQNWALVHRQWSMATGGVLATRRSVLEELNGFDESFDRDLDGIDLCLRMRMLGYRVVYTPFAEFVHRGAPPGQNPGSRGSVLARFLTRWGEFIERDPSSHPQLTRRNTQIVPLQPAGRWWQQAEFRNSPVISVIVPVYNVAAIYLERCIESIKAQSYPFWQLCLADDGSTNPETLAVLRRYEGSDARIRVRYLPNNLGIAAASNHAVEMSTGDYLAMLDNDDELAPDALLHVAIAVSADRTIDCLYTDEDKLDPSGEHREPYCKPDWSPEHLESVMYVLHLLVVRKSLFLDIGGFREEFSGAQDYDLMLRISRKTARIHHIPEVDYHWRMVPGSAAAQVDAKPAALDAAKRALADHIAIKHGGNAWVEPGLLPGHFRLRHRIAGDPPVTILITTNNSRTTLAERGEFVMVDNLVRSILEKTSYANHRIIVVDNGNSSAEQLDERRRHGVKTIAYPCPAGPFNYARKCNFSVRQVSTEHLVILNDDMEVINRDWLEALLEFSQLPDIGVVGAKLFHADGTIQHCGIVIGVNQGSAHMYHSFPGDFVGYNSFTHIVRNYSAVTGACIATRKSVWTQANGLDEKFATDFNDTDFCLRVCELGYRIVFTPHAELFHYEGKTSVRKTQNPAEVELFRRRWHKYMANDPYYNPNLAREGVEFRLRAENGEPPVPRDATAAPARR